MVLCKDFFIDKTAELRPDGSDEDNFYYMKYDQEMTSLCIYDVSPDGDDTIKPVALPENIQNSIKKIIAASEKSAVNDFFTGDGTVSLDRISVCNDEFYIWLMQGGEARTRTTVGYLPDVKNPQGFDEYWKAHRIAGNWYNIAKDESYHPKAVSFSKDDYKANTEALNKLTDYFYELSKDFIDINGTNFCTMDLTTASETSDAVYISDHNGKSKEVFLTDDIKNTLTDLRSNGIHVKSFCAGSGEAGFSFNFSGDKGFYLTVNVSYLIKSYDKKRPDIIESVGESGAKYKTKSFGDRWYYIYKTS